VLSRLEYYFRHMGKSCAASACLLQPTYNQESMEQWVADEINADGHVSSIWL